MKNLEQKQKTAFTILNVIAFITGIALLITHSGWLMLVGLMLAGLYCIVAVWYQSSVDYLEHKNTYINDEEE